MRNFLTFVAVALVTALTTALVAPPLIDWSARREMVARAIAVRIGAPVQISGPITLRVLPTPFLEIADVAIGPPGAPWLKGPSMRFEFGLTSLIGGKLRLDDVLFDSPVVEVGPRLAPPADSRLEFAHMRARHAEVRVARPGGSPIVVKDIAFDGSALSPRGPWRGGGDFASPTGGRANFDFASEVFDADALPIKAEIDSGATRVDFDGRLVLAAAPRLEGTATFAGEAPAPDGGVWPWRIAGALSASEDDGAIDQAEVRLGADARSLEAEGRLALRFGDKPALEADLKAKTLNIDALLRRDKETFAPPARAADAFAEIARRALRRDAPLASFSLKLASGSAFLGARTLDKPALTLSGAPGGAMRLTLDSGLPGSGRLRLDGDCELGASPIFRGRAEGEVGEFEPLAAWIAEGQPELAERLDSLGAALPGGAISASGDVEFSASGYSVRGLNLGVAASRFDGGIIYQHAAADRPGRLYLDLASDALDIEAAPNIEAGLAWLGDTDLDFSLKANTLRVARVGLASMQGGSLVIRATKIGSKFALERLSLADLGGASIEAQGETSPSGRWTILKLDAGRLGDFAALLARAAPGALTRWFLQHADDLGSAKATFEARRDGPPIAAAFPLDFLKADGEIAGSRFALTLSRAPAPVDAIAAQATLDAPDAGALLRKLGAKISPGAAGRAVLSLNGSGQWESGFEGGARLDFAGADLNWTGALRPEATGDAPWITGPLTLKSADIFPALAALGAGVTGTGATAPADLAADFTASTGQARVSRLAGTLAGAHVNGELAWAQPREAASLGELIAMAQSSTIDAGGAPPPPLTGDLEFDHASLGALLSLVLGRPGPTRPGGLWSPSKFGPALLRPPSADIALKVGALDLGYGVGRSMTSRLRLDRDQLALDDVALALNGGQVGGRVTLRRDKAQTTANGALTATGVGVEKAGVRGRLDLAVDFAGAGDTAAALVGGLAGVGRLKIVDAKWPRLDPEALVRVMEKIEQAAGPPPEEKRLEGQIATELDRGPLALEGAEGSLDMSSGALRFGPLATPVRDGAATVSGAFDLGDLTLSLEAKLVDNKVGAFWSGPPPSVEIAVRDAGDPPQRRIDAASLVAGLAAEALARETDRIANFEADLRERAAFNRQLKAERFLARRDEEIAEFEAEQERRRLMAYYLGPYTAWAASRREAQPSARSDGRSAAKDPTSNGLY